jgi:hypothetical protein
MDVTLYKLLRLYMDIELFKIDEFPPVGSTYLVGVKLGGCGSYV